MKHENMDMLPERTCVPWEQVITNVQIATAYVPIQKLCTTMTPLRSLREGTAFPEFLGGYWNRTGARGERDE